MAQSHPSSQWREAARAGATPSIIGMVVAGDANTVAFSTTGAPAGTVLIDDDTVTCKIGDFTGTGGVVAVGNVASTY